MRDERGELRQRRSKAACAARQTTNLLADRIALTHCYVPLIRHGTPGNI
ncbi:MAG: hypothetical protein J7485_07950 [Sphingobium sp.]|nr:hypothetical protein [Sphingobium sp.]